MSGEHEVAAAILRELNRFREGNPTDDTLIVDVRVDDQPKQP